MPYIVFYRAFIEFEKNQIFDEFVEQFESRGNFVDIIPIVLNGKRCDFTYHDTLEKAQKFCIKLGFVINPYTQQEAAWAGKLFRVK